MQVTFTSTEFAMTNGDRLTEVTETFWCIEIFGFDNG